MWRRFAFMPAVFLVLISLHTWTRQVESEGGFSETAVKTFHPEAAIGFRRRELIEALDHLVRAERDYHSVHGHYTKILSRIELSLPQALVRLYDIRVLEASDQELRIQAVSEIEGQPTEVVTLDDQFRLRANFPLPVPRPGYLRELAVRHARTLETQSQAEAPEDTVYSGFFRYERREDSAGRVRGLAVGLRPPVLGVQLDSRSELIADFEGPDPATESEAGQRSTLGWVASEDPRSRDRGGEIGVELGRYARSYSDVSQIVSLSLAPKSPTITHSLVPGRKPSQIVVEKIDNP